MGRAAGVEVELRVDIDGERPMNRVSADYFRVHRDDKVYLGSMCVDEPIVATIASGLTITGVSRSTWHTDANQVRVTISRGTPGAGAPGAALRHHTASGRTRASYECAYVSASFRTVLLEEDGEQGVERFESYDTGLLEAPSPPRAMTIASAFADAGVEVVRVREPGVVAGGNASWSDAELHAAMVKHFTAFADVPQWAMWLLHARVHDSDRDSNRGSLLGLMFDRRGRQRQGCAVFYDAIDEPGAQRLRTELFTCVHEAAHTFNLLHSFQASHTIPPVPSRPASATWMAYPGRFPGGSEAFWSTFAFQFDDDELRHLRHAMRADVIMGGSPLAGGAAFEADGDPSTEQEDPGLRLTLTAPPVIAYGVPVTVQFALSGTTTDGRSAPSVLGPRCGNVDILIRDPDGNARLFEPLLRHCRAGDAIVVCACDPAVHDSAFIHYGKDGFAFDRPGRYEITALCALPDGASVQSNVAQIIVRGPASHADKHVARLIFDEQQGELMSLVGSDAPELRHGNDALQEIIERYPRHAVASVARVIHATNAARAFKSVQLDGSVRVRRPDPNEAASILRGTPVSKQLRQAAGSAAEMLPVVILGPLDGTSAGPAGMLEVYPYIRSRIKEIAFVMPEIFTARRSVRRRPATHARKPSSPMKRSRS